MNHARDDPKPKIGEGTLPAFLRQGAREIRAALYPESNVAQPAEMGTWGTLTPGEIAQARRADSPELEEEQSSILADRLKQVEATREDHGREDKGLEKE